VVPRAIVVPSGPEDLYLEVAAVVTTLLIAGRLLEDRAKRQAGAALRALLELSARDVAIVSDGGREERVPIEALRAGCAVRRATGGADRDRRRGGGGAIGD